MTRSISIRFPLSTITGYNNCQLARRTGFSIRTIQRWTTTGIPLYSADRLAIRLGFHPATIWPNWYNPI